MVSLTPPYPHTSQPHTSSPPITPHSLLKRVSLDVAERPLEDLNTFSNTATQDVRAPNAAPLGGRIATGFPVYVMLPLDTVWLIDCDDGSQRAIIKREKAMDLGLSTLKTAGVEGVMVDVWWGIVEREPGVYDFSAYQRLFEKVREAGLKIQAVMSFHAAGGNVGDTCTIPLPKWVLDVGDEEPGVFYTDRQGIINRECLSLGCDELPLFQGRTPLKMYRDFVAAFADTFGTMFGMMMMMMMGGFLFLCVYSVQLCTIHSCTHTHTFSHVYILTRIHPTPPHK